MANVNHSSLTDPLIHEPKGVASASVGKVYVANGSGSGTWTSKETLVGETLTGYIDNISASSTVYVPIPFSSANATLTVKNAAAASMGTITVTQSGSAAGDVDTLAPSSNNTVAADSFITIASDGGSTNTATLRFVVVLDRS